MPDRRRWFLLGLFVLVLVAVGDLGTTGLSEIMNAWADAYRVP